MPRLIKNGELIARDEWTFVASADNFDHHQSVHMHILSIDLYRALAATEKDLDNTGFFLAGDYDLKSLDMDLGNVPLIAIEFPQFMDGRGFSLARSIREQFDYTGELRAIGNFIPDQLYYMTRCGFNSFLFAHELDKDTLDECLKAFSEYYQAASDDPQPLFRRRV